MTQPNSTLILAQLAKLFRQEGDHVTADALEQPRHSALHTGLSGKQIKRVRSLRNRGIRLNNMGAHAEAIPLLTKVLKIVEAAFGPGHLETADDLNTLAGCQYNKGDFAAALADYSRLQRLLELAYGADDALTKIAQDRIEQCQRGLCDRLGSLRLNRQITLMLAQAQSAHLVNIDANTDRMRQVAARLLARGRRLTAIRLYERWITERLHDRPSDDELALLDIRQYAMDLHKAGETQRSATVLRQLAALRNRQSACTDDKQALASAMRDLSCGLASAGQQRSAQEAADLADAISKRYEIALHRNS
jgi:hypothetical protein